MTLFEQAATYLETEGWEVTRGTKGASSIVGSRELMGVSTTLTVWCPSEQEMQHVRQWEPAMQRRFAEDGSPGNKILLLNSVEGLSRDFRDSMTKHDVKFRAPVQFFDRTFCWDDAAPDGKRAASVAARMCADGVAAARQRVRQPYVDDAGNHGDDLLDDLARRFESSIEWPRPIVLVTAPAGYGKTMLFQALFSRLHEHFHTAKRRQDRARRPLPLVPEYMGQAGSNTLSGLVDEFLSTDVAAPMSRASFEWMLTNGYACWMLDGLDEMMARDPHFFEYIDEIIHGGDKVVVPRILICARDSLLSTSEPLRALINEVDDWVTRYELQQWKRDSISTFATMQLTKKDDWKMMAWVDKRPQVLELCSTPFYAKLVADRVRDNDIGLGVADLPAHDLVQQAVRAILKREYDKGLFRQDVFALNELYYLVRDAAKLQLEGVPRGIDIAQLTELTELLAGDVAESEREAVAGHILKLSVFRAGDRGRIWFTHDAIQEYLVGEQASQYFGSHPGPLLDLLNWSEFPADSIALRILTEHVETHGGNHELPFLLTRARSVDQTTAFRNLLGVVLQLRDAGSLLGAAPLDKQDLSGLTFRGLDLAGVRMCDAILDSVTFEDCDLTGLDLTGATLLDTRFTKKSATTIHAATYGDLSGLMSVYVNKQHVDTPAAFEQLLRRSGRRAGATVDPCNHAMQLRKIFSRFLFPNGRLRWPRVERNNLVRGAGAEVASDLLTAALRAGFLTRVSGQNRYECAKGQLYKGMVTFARNLETTPEIVALLDSVCPIKGCTHIGL